MPIPLGISGDTGLPLDAIDEPSLNAFRGRSGNDAASREDLAAKADSDAPNFGAIGDVNPNQLDQTGWAVIFAPAADRRIREALRPLLDYRKAQIGDENLFKIFEGPTGFQPGDAASIWLSRQNVSMNVVDPLLGVPFYITIVGPPDEIPFEFQYSLDLYWAVGRLWSARYSLRNLTSSYCRLRLRSPCNRAVQARRFSHRSPPPRPAYSPLMAAV
jgi:hypothetical protein